MHSGRGLLCINLLQRGTNEQKLILPQEQWAKFCINNPEFAISLETQLMSCKDDNNTRFSPPLVTGSHLIFTKNFIHLTSCPKQINLSDLGSS